MTERISILSKVQSRTPTFNVYHQYRYVLPSLFIQRCVYETSPDVLHQIGKQKTQKQSTAGIRWWSPTQLLASRPAA